MSGIENCANMKIRNVHSSLQSVLEVLNKEAYRFLPEVNQLLSLWKVDKSTPDYNSSKNVFIVLEGLDGSGKSTISKILSKNLNAVLKYTPPSIIAQLRTKFDDGPEDLRRAYYSLGNYIVAEDIRLTLCNQPVVMDRFWNSTAAYGIANEISQSGNLSLPPENDSVYKWPDDLLKPDFTFFLNVDEEHRNERLSRRKFITADEDKLNNESAYRKTLLEAYMRMKNNSFVIIDSNVTKPEVVEQIMKILKSSGRVNEKFN